MAPEGLPEGLVRNREGVTAVGEGIDRVEVDQVAACWQSGSSLLQPCVLITDEGIKSLFFEQSCARR